MAAIIDATKEPAQPAASTKRKTSRRPSDIFGALAAMAENRMPISPTSQCDLQQKRLWPPPPYQAYCTKHFIQECLIYYSLERDELQAAEERLKKSMVRYHAKKTPTRVQPRRKAKGQTEAAAQGEPGPDTKGRKRTQGKIGIEKYIQERKTRLQLHLSWATFRAHLEAIIGATPQAQEAQCINTLDEEISRNKDDREKYLNHESCPFQSRIPPGCRYCHHKPPTTPVHGKPPERRAPMAPMHSVGPEYIEEQPIHTLGGLRFAVDACGKEKLVVLVDLDTQTWATNDSGENEQGPPKKTHKRGKGS